MLGSNGSGQLGDGTITDRLTPVLVGGGHRFTMVRAGSNHTCGLTSAGIAWCWGHNQFAELGIGNTTGPQTCPLTGACSKLPVRVTGGLVFRQILPGGFHTCGLAEDRRLRCWGDNRAGQLGDGSVVTRTKPVAVYGNREFSQADAGSYHTCAVDPDHHAWCWGQNPDGRVGDGTTTERHRPVRVTGGLLFEGISAGGLSTCATTTQNRTYCWGDNLYGQLGDGSNATRHAPALVAGGKTWERVVTGYWTTCGIASGDRPFCWGNLVGDGTQDWHNVPTAVSGPS